MKGSEALVKKERWKQSFAPPLPANSAERVPRGGGSSRNAIPGTSAGALAKRLQSGPYFSPSLGKAPKMAVSNSAPARRAGATVAAFPPASGSPTTVQNAFIQHISILRLAELPQHSVQGRGRHAEATFPALPVRVRVTLTGTRLRACPSRTPARASAPSPFRVGPSRQRGSMHRGQQRAVWTQVCSGAIGVWKMPPDGGLGLQLR